MHVKNTRIAVLALAALSWLLNPQVTWDDADQYDRGYWRRPQAVRS
mgnify:CR=1 FL=1